jgi:FkbM family methyltransferase
MKGLKVFVRKVLPKNLQRQLRSYYLTKRVLSGKYIEPEMAILRRIIRSGQAVVDIGANIGFYTLYLSELVGPSGSVYAFEPISENFEILSRAVRMRKLQNVKPFFAAVNREPGEREMIIPDNGDFTGFYQAHLADREDAGMRELVHVSSLDQLLSDGVLSAVDFIKCDAEGSELGILQGGIKLLNEFHPSLLVEIQGKTSKEVFDLLHGLDYKSYVLQDGFMEIERFDAKFWNYFFFSRMRTPNSAAQPKE